MASSGVKRAHAEMAYSVPISRSPHRTQGYPSLTGQYAEPAAKYMITSTGPVATSNAVPPSNALPEKAKGKGTAHRLLATRHRPYLTIPGPTILAQDFVYQYGGAAIRAREERRRRELHRVIDLCHCSSSAWYVLNKKYKGSGSKEYERPWDATSEVMAMIRSIRRQAGGECSFGTKRSALETLRKIGKSIALAPSTLGSEVRKQFQHEDCLKDAMIKLLKPMTVFERQDMAESIDEKVRFLDKVISLRNEFAALCIMDLDEVLQMMEKALEGHHTDEDTDPGRSVTDDGLEERSMDDDEESEEEEE